MAPRWPIYTFQLKGWATLGVVTVVVIVVVVVVAVGVVKPAHYCSLLTTPICSPYNEQSQRRNSCLYDCRRCMGR
jgi:hypothetical protein